MSLPEMIPHLAAFLEAEITPDGDRGRAVKVPKVWPAGSLNLSNQVILMPMIVGMQRRNRNELYVTYSIRVDISLYYLPAGQGLTSSIEYDLMHYWQDFAEAIVKKPRLPVNGTTMPGVSGIVELIDARCPTLLTYPLGIAEDDYVGAIFSLEIPIQISLC